MKPRLVYFLLIYLLFLPFQSFPQGLKIRGNDFLIDERSSYTVFDKVHPTFRDELVIDFEIAPMNLQESTSIGYVLRIKNEKANTTYNIFYNDQGGATVFKFNHEGRDALITAHLDREKLFEHQWIRIHIAFDLEKDSLLLRINDKTFRAGGLRLEKEWSPGIHFGRSEHVIDVPTFLLRNLSVSEGSKKYDFPLNESSGEDVHDTRKKVTGHVTNPVWLINDAYFWKAETVTLQSQSVAGSNMDVKTQEIYYFNKDSITFYNIRTKETYSRKYTNMFPMTLRLGTNFIDKEKNRLYVYEVSDPLSGTVMISYLDLDNYSWTAVSSELLPTQLHHHSSFFDKTNRRYIIFGGFGNTFYSKNFYSYDLEKNHWDTLSFDGDVITPRYFASMGYHEEENALYLFGGMGNESGDQFVGRVYYYDLYKIDLNRNRITKLWEIPWKKENMVPVRGMVLTDNYFYTVCYPEHFSKTYFKLFLFSIKDGSYEILGDSVPIISEKITTHANIYYNKRSNELYSIVQEFDHNDIGSTAKIYSLVFPPVTKDKLSYYSGTHGRVIWLSLILILLCLTGAIFYFAGKKKTRKPEPNRDQPDYPDHSRQDEIQQQEAKANAIYLFGDFTIRDRKNKDITYMLSTKLKQAFLILLHHVKDGISSHEFSELLWPGKPEDKVKNSRGVTLNNLRKILGELDGISLIHERKSYKLVFTDQCYCDYAQCMDILTGSDIENNLTELVGIISRGKFLKSVDIPSLDPFKEFMEQRLEPVLIVGMEQFYTSGHYPETIILCDSLFHIDPANEEALHYMTRSFLKQKMAEEAKRRYLLFIAEYKKTMNEDYPKSFIEVVS